MEDFFPPEAASAAVLLVVRRTTPPPWTHLLSIVVRPACAHQQRDRPGSPPLHQQYRPAGLLARCEKKRADEKICCGRGLRTLEFPDLSLTIMTPTSLSVSVRDTARSTMRNVSNRRGKDRSCGKRHELAEKS
jgi:hypothetical protein